MREVCCFSRALFVIAIIGNSSSVFAERVLGPMPTSPTNHEVRDLATGEIFSCACQMSGSDFTCHECVPYEGPKIELAGNVGKYGARWHEIIARLKDEGWRPASLVELEIRVDDYRFEFVISCKDNPNERRFKKIGLTMPQTRDGMVDVIRDAVREECDGLNLNSRSYFGSFGDRRAKIRVSPGDGSQYWQDLLRHLFADETIADGVAELVFDPFPVTEDSKGMVFYRAEISFLRCANGQTKPYHGNMVLENPLKKSDFRRWVRDHVVKACKL